MNTFKTNKGMLLCLLSGTLYGLSWPLFSGINLSFLAWGAFVPLLIFLEKHRGQFWKSMAGSYLAMVVFGCFSAGWLFNFPEGKLNIAVIFFAEEFWITMPFLPFFLLQRRIGFDRALWMLPLLWMLWEWIYLGLEFTMGTHLSAYSQSGNPWLIQFIDITGMWGLSAWLMLFNVLLFKAFKSAGYRIRSTEFIKKTAFIALAMLCIPVLYSTYAYQRASKQSQAALKVTLVPTQFPASELSNPQNFVRIIEETLHRSDSLAFYMADIGQFSDLYLWPETGVPYQLAYSNLGSLLFEAVSDWQGALLTGCRGVPGIQDTLDKRTYVSGVLLSHKNSAPEFHHKTILTPGHEVIPYHHWLARIPGFPVAETSPRFHRKGTQTEPLELVTRDARKFNVGVSLCFEQWYPEVWTKTTQHGADLFVHLAGEGWYGNVGFQAFMANVTRMRCIENRRQAARCANVGLSMFIDETGGIHHQSKPGSLQSATADVTALKTRTFYSAHPSWFPVAGMLFLLGLLGYFKFFPSALTHSPKS
ncbi:MAG: apolipoprotein N-acyltransferase [Lewinellaceae bacterium]|nr:apolipoprotein N-acyltransferase [Saprospiraceae bacterium]MCB9344540.1 apolipoprotein N-acyltransferase [Lewinellaceae bacterium]